MNYFKTTLLLVALTLLLLLVGNMLGGRQGVVFAFVIAMGMNFFSYWFSDKIVLMMYKAKDVSDQESSDYYRIVKELTAHAGLPMPRLYVIPTNAMNAFATGRNPRHAAVAVTEGMLGSLSREELKGVLGHELSHVKNRDILISAVVATIAGAIMMLANMAPVGRPFWRLWWKGRRRQQGERVCDAVFGNFSAYCCPLNPDGNLAFA